MSSNRRLTPWDRPENGTGACPISATLGAAGKQLCPSSTTRHLTPWDRPKNGIGASPIRATLGLLEDDSVPAARQHLDKTKRAQCPCIISRHRCWLQDRPAHGGGSEAIADRAISTDVGYKMGLCMEEVQKQLQAIKDLIRSRIRQSYCTNRCISLPFPRFQADWACSSSATCQSSWKGMQAPDIQPLAKADTDDEHRPI